MKILITGSTGFVGGYLVRRLMHDHELYCLTRKPGALPANPNVRGIEQDLTRPLETAALPGALDAVIHLAQSRHFRKFPEQALDVFQVNTESTARLLDYGRQAKIKTFVLASSGGVCGYQPRPILESDPPELINFYLASKYAAECLANAYSEQFVPVILRYFFVYGEGQRDMFMPGLVNRVLQKQAVTVAGKTGVTMNPVHVADAVEATVKALAVSRPDTFNVAGAETTTVHDLAALIGELAGTSPVYQFEPDKTAVEMVANVEKMRLKLGVTPKVSLKEGLDRLIKDIRG